MLNFSFEKATGCGEIGNCTKTLVDNWHRPTLGTPDWFNPCDGSPHDFWMPQNYAGYQLARSGTSYAGIAFDNIFSPYREYITGTLSDSLKTNKKYCVDFFVSLGDSLWYAGSALGAYFTKDNICDSTFDSTLHYVPQIENPLSNFIIDKINWIPISGEFTASGGEIFITIGDFYSSSSYDSVGHGGLRWTGGGNANTYYYIDDVYVRELTIANAGKADTVCLGDSVLIGKDTITSGVSFHWLPTAGLSNPNIPQPKASPTSTTTYTLTVINDSIHNCNCADSVTKDFVTISVCTGINELKVNNIRVNISPNPNNGVFVLSMNSISSKPEIQLYNVLGQNVFQINIISNATEINLRGQPPGIYFYRVLTQNGAFIVSGKIIIQK